MSFPISPIHGQHYTTPGGTEYVFDSNALPAGAWYIYGGGGSCSGATGLLGIPTIGGWTGGFFSEWYPEYTETDAFWDVSDIIKYIAPADATTLQGTSLTIASTTVYNGRLSDGNINYPTGYPAGSTYSTIVTDVDLTLSTAASPIFNKADKGSLEAYINGVVTDTFDIEVSFDESLRPGVQTYPPATSVTGILTIDSVGWYNSFPKWQRGSAHLNIIPGWCRQGWNYFSMKHEEIPTVQQSNNYNLFWDQGVTGPLIITPTVVQDTPVYRYLSGIKFYDRGSTFDLSTTASYVFDNTYHADSPVQWSSTNSTMNAGNIDWNDVSVSGVSTPPAITDTTMTITNKVITVPNSNARSTNARATVLSRKPWVTSASLSSASANRLIDAYAITSTTLYEYFDDEDRRLPAAAYNVIPAPISGVWDSTAILVNGNAQVYNGSMMYPTIDFSSGYLPAQDVPARDYSGFAGSQTFYRAMYKAATPKSSGTLEILSLVSADIAPVGTGNVNFEIKLPGQTGWLDLGTSYSSGTFTGIDGDGCRVSVTGNTWSWTCGTFTTSLSGFMTIIRVTLRNSTKSIASIRETSW